MFPDHWSFKTSHKSQNFYVKSDFQGFATNSEISTRQALQHFADQIKLQPNIQPATGDFRNRQHLNVALALLSGLYHMSREAFLEEMVLALDIEGRMEFK